jgi:hypothetical protein
MNMTPEDIGLPVAVESLPVPSSSEGQIPPGILLQEVIQVNKRHDIQNGQFQNIMLISYAYTISYTNIVYCIVFDIVDCI